MPTLLPCNRLRFLNAWIIASTSPSVSCPYVEILSLTFFHVASIASVTSGSFDFFMMIMSR